MKKKVKLILILIIFGVAFFAIMDTAKASYWHNRNYSFHNTKGTGGIDSDIRYRNNTSGNFSSKYAYYDWVAKVGGDTYVAYCLSPESYGPGGGYDIRRDIDPTGDVYRFVNNKEIPARLRAFDTAMVYAYHLLTQEYGIYPKKKADRIVNQVTYRLIFYYYEYGKGNRGYFSSPANAFLKFAERYKNGGISKDNFVFFKDIDGKTNFAKGFEFFEKAIKLGDRAYNNQLSREELINILNIKEFEIIKNEYKEIESTIDKTTLEYDVLLKNAGNIPASNIRLNNFEVVSKTKGVKISNVSVAYSGSDISVKFRASGKRELFENEVLIYIKPWACYAGSPANLAYVDAGNSKKQKLMFVIPDCKNNSRPVLVSGKVNDITTTCFSTDELNPESSNFDPERFSSLCCSSLDLSNPEHLGYYNQYCSCYSTPSLTPGNSSFNPSEFAKTCCSDPNLKQEDSIKYCTSCESKVCFDGDCTVEDGEGITAEINSIEGNQNIKACVLGKNDQLGNSYELTSIIKNNPYCKVYCKEDFYINLPETVKGVRSGTYFTLRTSIKGTKTCYTDKINYTTFNNDYNNNTNALTTTAALIKTLESNALSLANQIQSLQTERNNAKTDKAREEIDKKIADTNAEISANSASLEAARANIGTYNAAINNSITSINSCATWESELKLTPTIKYTYSEDYIKTLISNNNEDVFHGTVTSSSSSLWTCDGEVDNNYNTCTSNTSTTIKTKEITKTTCDTNGNCTTSKTSVPVSNYIRKTSNKEGIYQPRATFYTKYVTGNITTSATNANNLLGLPVSLGTNQGVYAFAINFSDIGEYYDTGNLGRLIGNNGISTTCDTNNKDYLSYVCVYEVNCPECEYFCSCSDNSMDGFECVKEDQYTCTLLTTDDCEDEGCAYDNGIKYFYRTVSLNNLNPNERDLGYNWNTEKGEETKKEIEEKGENAYQTAEYTFTLTPSAIRALKRYNKSQEANGGYAANTLECENGIDENGKKYENLICKSQLLNQIESGEINIPHEMNRTWELWTKNIGLDVGTGPAWK